jgi:6-carboxyhexanoate--CoA ligase
MRKHVYYSVRMRAAKSRVHVSGAEGIYDKDDVDRIVKEYTNRAFLHDKGVADDVRIVVEKLSDKPKMISSLPVSTLNTRNSEAAMKAAIKLLSSAGITERAVEESFKSLSAGMTMRGAMLMNVEGVRLEPDLLRGVRVTRMGITKKASADLSRKLARHGMNNNTVKEALILASKVHKYRLVLGELCISDDPRYTTGYIAGRSLGYIRLPRIKKRGIPYGGRAFFIAGGEVKDLIPYLQNIPVLVNDIKPIQGIVKLRDILGQKSRR